LRYTDTALAAARELRRRVACGEPLDPKLARRLECSVRRITERTHEATPALLAVLAEVEALTGEITTARAAVGEALRAAGERVAALSAYGGRGGHGAP